MAGMFGSGRGGFGGGDQAGLLGLHGSDLGVLGASLRDAMAYFGGRPEAANALMPAIQRGQEMQQQRGLLAALNSEDPAQRQKAYSIAPMYGIDPAPFQKAQAMQQVPAMLKSLQPQNVNVPQVSGQLPNGQTVDGGGFGFNTPGLSMQEAIAAAPPEAQQQYAPDLVKNQMQIEAEANKPFDLSPGQHRFAGGKEIASLPEKNNPNQPFNVDGTPNKAYQAWKRQDQIAGRALVQDTGWQLANDPKTNKQFRINIRTGQTLGLDGQPYHAEGLAKLQSGNPRSAASLAAQRFMQENPDATASDIAQFSADFGATGKSVSSFASGKQGDLIRSFNVGISHLNTLDGLVGALHNGNVQAFNKLGNAYSQQTGNPAPANFDAAKAIVGDEIIKAIVGGGGALADRENAQNQINRANSPQQLSGVIKTYKELMAGQLGGLKKQYSDTTHRNNFDDRLSPEAKAELEGRGKVAGPQSLPRLPKMPATGHIRTYNPATGRLE